jgi:1,4-dihydroxy-2-naphthoate octaprenyltransferase
MAETRARLSIWWQAFRFHFVPPSYLPAILGGVLAWALTGRFHFGYFLATVIGVTVNHIALNMTDDYFDFIQAVDRAKDRGNNPYSGGSGTLTSGGLRPEQMRIAFLFGYSVTIFLGLLLALRVSWLVAVFGAFGMASAYFYTAPPVRYGYHGFGEISQLINFSFTIGMGAYFVQTQAWSWEALLVVLPLGLMMFSMITINEIPDEHTDREAGKRNLVVIFGKRTAVRLYTFFMIGAFGVIILAPLFGYASPWIYLALVTFPWLIQAVRILANHADDPAQMSPANMLTIRIHNVTGIFLVFAYIFEGIQTGQNFADVWGALLTLAILYFPVGLTIFTNVLTIKPATP